ncbi:MAG: hypothetical protein IPN01_32465 [Deltaproteobacteria bacterium]|nr:hypothetical protein [Deltaproteobacteria bacterium]
MTTSPRATPSDSKLGISPVNSAEKAQPKPEIGLHTLSSYTRIGRRWPSTALMSSSARALTSKLKVLWKGSSVDGTPSRVLSTASAKSAPSP